MIILRQKLTRRSILKAAGGGFFVLLALDEPAFEQESGGPKSRREHNNDLPTNVAAWIQINAKGGVTVFTGKTEVGQNIRTSLTQAVADELRIDPNSIRLVMADTALTPYDFGTVGSRTTPSMAPQLRKMAATAREQIITTAALRWKTSRDKVVVSKGFVTDKTSSRQESFGTIAASVDWIHVLGSDDCLTPPDQWQSSGKNLAKVNGTELVTGKHRYTSDLKRPGMLYGRILRPPALNATLQNLDTSEASRMSGVTVLRDGDLIGVAAPDEFVAAKAIAALKPAWQTQKQISSPELFEYLKTNPAEADPSRKVHPVNTGEDAAITGDKQLQSSYTIAYIAHVPLEPRSAVAEWNGSKLTVWAGTQRPFGVRSELSEALKMPEGDVRVIVPDTGSAYGGKHTGEHALEAAKLAKAAGRPVKLMWTREEEFMWAYFRPAGVIDIRSAVAKDGSITSWDFVNYNSGPSGLQSPYNSAHANIRFQPTKYPLRQGSYRGLAGTANHFARESHIDEMAVAIGMDPLAFRLKNLKDERVRAVLTSAASRFGWQNANRTAGRGYGLACGLEKGSYFACCAEISLNPVKQIKVERVTEAFECGTIINPEHLKNQVEGAIVMGMGGALFEAIEFTDGQISNGRLAKYRVPRFSDVPAIEVVLVERKDLPPVGAGETPIMGIAAAIGNAVFQASGIRVRSMPIEPAFKTASV